MSRSVTTMLASPEYRAIRHWFAEGVCEIAKREGFAHQNDTRLLRSKKNYDCTVEYDHLTADDLALFEEAALALFDQEIRNFWKTWTEDRAHARHPAEIDERAMQNLEALVRSIVSLATIEKDRAVAVEDEALCQKARLLSALIADEKAIPAALESFDGQKDVSCLGKLVNKIVGFHGARSPKTREFCARMFPKCESAYEEGCRMRTEKLGRDQTVDSIAIANAERAYEERNQALSESQELTAELNRLREEVDDLIPQELERLHLELDEKQEQIERMAEDAASAVAGQKETFHRAVARLQDYAEEVEDRIADKNAELAMKRAEIDATAAQINRLHAKARERSDRLSQRWKPEQILPSRV